MASPLMFEAATATPTAANGTTTALFLLLGLCGLASSPGLEFLVQSMMRRSLDHDAVFLVGG